jgi:ubiquinone/menaquinone biosynthesis C-methylase UbiE
MNQAHIGIRELKSRLSHYLRRVKPGGRLVITDLDQHPHTWLREEHHDLWLGFERQQVQEWLETAGLVNVLVEDTGQTCRSQPRAEKEKASVSIFITTGTRPDPHMVEVVQSHYRQVAVGGSSCCGPAPSERNSPGSAQGACPERFGYAQDGPAEGTMGCCAPAVPDDAVQTTLSLGCGNPVALASLRPGEVVLDVGSGAGADVFPAAQRVGPEGKVIGVDVLPEMLERARRTALAHGYSNVEFRQGDALGLPMEDETVDVVMSNCVINLVQDKGRAFREAHRVLRPGGRLAISDIVTERPFSPAVRRDAQSWAACVSGALSEADYMALIAQAGFADITVARSQPWTADDGTRVYSVHLKAVKGSPED